MLVPDGAAAAVPAALQAAARDVRAVADELADLARRLGPVAAAGGCEGSAPAALSGLVAAWQPALGRLAERSRELTVLAEGTAAEFQSADGG